MTLTRRRVLSVLSVTGTSAVSGCAASIIANSDDDDDDKSDTDSINTGESNTSDNSEKNQDQQENQSQTSPPQQVEQAIDFADWLSSGYEDSYEKYNSVVEDFKNIFKNYYNRDAENIRVSELRTTAEKAEQIWRNIDEIFDGYYQYYYPFNDLVTTIRKKIIPSILRGEYQYVSDKFYELYRTFAELNQSVLAQYPRLIVSGYPETKFLRVDSVGKIKKNNQRTFEIYYETSSNSPYLEDGKAGFFITPTQINIRQHPFGKNPQLGNTVDNRIRREYQDLKKRNATIFKQSEWMRNPINPVSTMHLNVFDYSLIANGYPSDYAFTEDTTARSEASVPDFDQQPSVKILLLEFQNNRNATAAFETITKNGVTDGTIQHRGAKYTKCHSINTSETYYADITTVDQFVVVVDINSTQWFRRSRSSQVGDQDITADTILEGTFLDFSTKNTES